MIHWFLAPALATLRGQLDKAYSTRDRTSDGTIGDQAHAQRKSDHNPDPDGEVKALDVDRDIAVNFNARNLADAIAAVKDPRISYMISRGQIMSGNAGPAPWTWRAYHGPNGHFEHTHFSVTKPGARNPAFWHIADGYNMPFEKSVTPEKPKGDVPKVIAAPAILRPVLRIGDAGPDVGYLQRMLGGLTVDNEFGPATAGRVKRYQLLAGLRVTGATDPEFWHHLED